MQPRLIHLIVFSLFATVLACGCAPTISYRTDTKILPTGACIRKVIVRGRPHKSIANQTVHLKNYLDFPPAELYETFALTPAQLVMGGQFASPDAVPHDFSKQTLHTKSVAENKILFRQIDLILFQVMDFEERIDDIVKRSDAETAIDELVTLLITESTAALQDVYGTDYDISGVTLYMKDQLPRLARRLYARLWEIRRARRGGILFYSERREWKDVLAAEGKRFGIPLQTPHTKKQEEANRKAIHTFASTKIKELIHPRAKDTPPFVCEIFHNKQERDKLLTALQASITKRHGSLKTFTDKVEPYLPRIFGAFLINQFSWLPTNPQFDMQLRLELPGHIVQTNGLQDMDGRILWSFTEEEMGLTGYSMWARSILLNPDAIRALGLVNFPGRINMVERYYREFRDGSGNALREPLLQVIRQCVADRSFKPLETLASYDATKKSTNENTPDATTIAAAKRLLALLKRYRPAPAPAEEPELGVVEPDTEKGLSSLAAPGQYTDKPKSDMLE